MEMERRIGVLARVDHKDDIIDRDRGLCNVGRENDLASAVVVIEHFALLAACQLAVQRQDYVLVLLRWNKNINLQLIEYPVG